MLNIVFKISLFPSTMCLKIVHVRTIQLKLNHWSFLDSAENLDIGSVLKATAHRKSTHEVR